MFVLVAACKNTEGTSPDWFCEFDIAEEVEPDGSIFPKSILKAFRIVLKRLCKKGLIEPHRSPDFDDEGYYVLTKAADTKTFEPSKGVAKELNAIKAAMAADRGFAWTWQCNLACCCMDEGADSEAANRSAARFMKLAFSIDVTRFYEYKLLSKRWLEDGKENDPEEGPDHPVRFEATSNRRPAGWRFHEQALDHCAYAIVENAGTKYQRFLSYNENGWAYQTVIRTTFTPSLLAKIPADMFTLSTTLHPVTINTGAVPNDETYCRLFMEGEDLEKNPPREVAEEVRSFLSLAFPGINLTPKND